MSDDDLKKLKRPELLRMLLDATRENERLEVELASTRSLLESRDLSISEAGSLADAALKLNGVFESAQAAADHYLVNVKQQYEDREQLVEQILAEAKERAQQIEADAVERARQVEEQAQQQAAEIRAQAEQTLEEARQAAERAETEANDRVGQIESEAAERAEGIRGEAQKVLDEARAKAEELKDEAKRQTETAEKDLRERIDARMAEAERVSSNLEQATKARCDTAMRRAMDEARQYNETMRMALQALGLNPTSFPTQPDLLQEASEPEDAPALADSPVIGQTEAPSESSEQVDHAQQEEASQQAGPDADAEEATTQPSALSGLDEAVSSARAAVAAALSTAKTEPGKLDDDAVAVLYPNAAADDEALRAAQAPRVDAMETEETADETGNSPEDEPVVKRDRFGMPDDPEELDDESRAHTASIIDDAVEVLARSATASAEEAAVAAAEEESPAEAANGQDADVEPAADADKSSKFDIPRGPAWGGDWDTVMSEATPIDPHRPDESE